MFELSKWCNWPRKKIERTLTKFKTRSQHLKREISYTLKAGDNQEWPLRLALFRKLKVSSVQSAAEASAQFEPSGWSRHLNLSIKGTQSWEKLKRGHIFCRLTTRSWCITLQYELQLLGNHAISFVWSRWLLSTASFACFVFVNENIPCRTPKLSGRSLFVLNRYFVFLSGAAWMILKCFNDSTRSPLSNNGQHEGWTFVKLTLFA